ncbi:MAG: Gfo/Idh/MocA family oxidoreductase [Flaviflexus sp.]|uniref:Gfo/Idh/MocA family oxidoreductase n=1 Tax=Flaviflexus sp. TaxID=1969482 RepID=UPI003F8FCE1A
MVNITVVGTGRIGTHHIGALVDRVKGATVTALVDTDIARAEELARTYSIDCVAASLDEAFEKAAVDAVVISSPVVTHLPLIRTAAAAGKAIFTEKPIGKDTAEAREATEVTAQAGVVFQVGFNRRFSESWAIAHENVSKGLVGEVQRYHSITRDPGPYGGNPATTPIGTIFKETLIHDFDTINWFMGDSRPVSVFASADALIRPDAKNDGFLDSAVVVIKYDNGAIATAEASFSAAYGYDLRGEVFGSAGMVQMGEPTNTVARTFTDGGMVVPTEGTDTSRYHESYVAEFDTFCRRVMGEDLPHPSGEDGVMAQAIAEAAQLSTSESRLVRIEEIL